MMGDDHNGEKTKTMRIGVETVQPSIRLKGNALEAVKSFSWGVKLEELQG